MARPRFVFFTLVAVLALTTTRIVHADDSTNSTRTSTAATATPQCVASLNDPNAPVVAPLVQLFGADLVRTVFGFITNTPFGKVLADESAHSCIANMNGTALGKSLKDALATPVCAPLATVSDVPFVKAGVALLEANAKAGGAAASISGILTFLKSIPNQEIDQFCNLYSQSLVPCAVSQLLPSLSIVRTKFASGCCQPWNDHVLADYGYSISGQLTKMAQLAGDVMCATQTPSFSGAGSQRCGFTLLQTLITKPDEASAAASLLRNLQVPSNQMCLRAEGQAYTDINGNSVDAATGSPELQRTPSGCVATIDRIASWVYGLPITQKSPDFDMKSLLEDGKCLQGSELFPTIKRLVPDLALSEIQVYFSKSCVHVPMKFSGKCTFSRPAALVEWANEPSPIKTLAPVSTDQLEGALPVPAATPTPAAASSSSALVAATSSTLLLLITAASAVLL